MQQMLSLIFKGENMEDRIIRTEYSDIMQKSFITSQVDYQPPFDVNDSFGEAFEAWTEKAGA